MKMDRCDDTYPAERSSISRILCLCSLLLAILVSCTPASEAQIARESLFRSLVFGGDIELRVDKNLHKSAEPLVPVAVTFGFRANAANIATRTLEGVADMLGIGLQYPNKSGAAYNFVVVYSDSPPRDLITKYRTIAQLLAFDSENDRLVAKKTAFKIKDGVLVEDPCLIFTLWRSHTVSRTFVIVDLRQPGPEIQACFLRTVSSHLGLGPKVFNTRRNLLVREDGRMSDTLKDLLSRLYSNNFNPGMTENRAMAAFRTSAPAAKQR